MTQLSFQGFNYQASLKQAKDYLKSIPLRFEPQDLVRYYMYLRRLAIQRYSIFQFHGDSKWYALKNSDSLLLDSARINAVRKVFDDSYLEPLNLLNDRIEDFSMRAESSLLNSVFLDKDLFKWLCLNFHLYCIRQGVKSIYPLDDFSLAIASSLLFISEISITDKVDINNGGRYFSSMLEYFPNLTSSIKDLSPESGNLILLYSTTYFNNSVL